MKTKTTLAIVGFLISITALPLSYLSRYLLYKHTQVPDVLWLLFWIDVPLNILIQIVSRMLANTKE